MYEMRIILSRPRDPKNIGAAARAMKNFGFDDLWIVSPFPPTWEEVTSAPNAEDLLHSAKIVDSLEDAIRDCDLIIGTIDRTRIESKQQLYTPVELVKELTSTRYKPALIFGSEKHGMTNDDLSRCNRIMSIPTQHECPSMNLGQAVAVCCYELIRELPVVSPDQNESELATAGAMEAATQLVIDVMRQIDFILPGNEPDLSRRVRGTLSRLNTNKYDIEMLCGILSRIKRGLNI